MESAGVRIYKSCHLTCSQAFLALLELLEQAKVTWNFRAHDCDRVVLCLGSERKCFEALRVMSLSKVERGRESVGC